MFTTIGDALAAYFSVPYEPFRNERIKPVDLLRNLKRDFVESNGWVPLEENKDGLLVMTTDPERLRASLEAGHGITPSGELVLLEKPLSLSLGDIPRLEQLSGKFGLGRLPAAPPRSQSGLFALADGMGGHPEGEVASQLALQTMAALFQRDAKPLGHALPAAFAQVRGGAAQGRARVLHRQAA